MSLNRGYIIRGCSAYPSLCRKTVIIEYIITSWQIIIKTRSSRPYTKAKDADALLRTIPCKSSINCWISREPARTALTTPSGEPSCSCGTADTFRTVAVDREVIIICWIRLSRRHCNSKIVSRQKSAVFQHISIQRTPRAPPWSAVWYLRSRIDHAPQAPH